MKETRPKLRAQARRSAAPPPLWRDAPSGPLDADTAAARPQDGPPLHRKPPAGPRRAAPSRGARRGPPHLRCSSSAAGCSSSAFQVLANSATVAPSTTLWSAPQEKPITWRLLSAPDAS
jgi:hypothetical protein